MSLDFTLDKYRELCEAITNSRYTSLTVGTYLTAQNPSQKCIVLRHDVDSQPSPALRMAEIEKEYEIKSTYYFRFSKSVFAPSLIGEIAAMGHEIGYHYEVLDKAIGDQVRAAQLFKQELEELRKIVEVTTVSMHGNPLTKWDNRDFWKRCSLGDFELKGEAYLSMDFEKVMYYSDTGRTWEDGKFNIKDVIPASMKSVRKPILATTDDLKNLIQSDKGNIYLLIHPERWTGSPMGYVKRYLIDLFFNIGKTMILCYRSVLRKMSISEPARHD
ncbi:hypothetical protein ACFLTZ_04150 [Chloroflexota bacterium]